MQQKQAKSSKCKSNEEWNEQQKKYIDWELYLHFTGGT